MNTKIRAISGQCEHSYLNIHMPIATSCFITDDILAFKIFALRL